VKPPSADCRFIPAWIAATWVAMEVDDQSMRASFAVMSGPITAMVAEFPSNDAV
jgi:hypothetical protein